MRNRGLPILFIKFLFLCVLIPLSRTQADAVFANYCNNCSQWVPGESNFCMYCGAELSPLKGTYSYYGIEGRAELDQKHALMIQDMDQKHIHRVLNAREEYRGIYDIKIMPLEKTDNLADQFQLIFNSSEVWNNEHFDYPCFAVTDLDHNGRLEIIAAENYSTGNYTRIQIFEVNQDGTGLDDVGTGIEWNFMLSYGNEIKKDICNPDILPDRPINPISDTSESIVYYLPAEGKIYYTLTNRSGGTEEYEEIHEALFLQDEALHIFPISWGHRDGTIVTYFNYKGEIIPESEAIFWRALFDGYESQIVTFSWFSLGIQPLTTELLKASYQVFAG